MVSWRLVFTKQAKRDAKKIAQSGFKPQAGRLLDLLKEDPYRNLPPYEKSSWEIFPALIPEESTYSTAWSTKFSMTSRR